MVSSTRLKKVAVTTAVLLHLAMCDCHLVGTSAAIMPLSGRALPFSIKASGVTFHPSIFHNFGSTLGLVSHNLGLSLNFLAANAQCWWNAPLTAATRALKYAGHVAPGMLLVTAEPCALEVLRGAYARSVLKPPATYVISSVDGKRQLLTADHTQITKARIISNFNTIEDIDNSNYMQLQARH
ncbi:unnamed protein product [Ceratitis capitata]|uniref:(Mediterranean fruit fly) hypothetical protein n=1 Tax=Ceratitis capitata TaxID=7213 RepID=A0A811V0V0_CERCA|nr:unnamed protein product [Ceratitis capitata]